MKTGKVTESLNWTLNGHNLENKFSYGETHGTSNTLDVGYKGLEGYFG